MGEILGRNKFLETSLDSKNSLRYFHYLAETTKKNSLLQLNVQLGCADRLG